jgi:hypothetical protein
MKPPNFTNMLNFVKYAILENQYMSKAASFLLNDGNKTMFEAYSSRAFEYAHKVGENRNEGITQKVLDKLFL